MTFDFSYMDKYPENDGFKEMQQFIFFEIGDIKERDDFYFLINGEIHEADHGWYDQVTAPRTYFMSMEDEYDVNNEDSYYAKKDGCESIVLLPNNHEIILSYLASHKDNIENYFKFRFKK